MQYSCMSICVKKINDDYAAFATARVAHLPSADRAVCPHQVVKQDFMLPVNI